MRKARAPMSAREILKRAFVQGSVPHRLYGKTQHKTLQARISEDILIRRERSSFFRTRPGVFFLREFITDKTIPAEFRAPIVARRRQRELARHQALAFDDSTVQRLCSRGQWLTPSAILSLIDSNKFHYAPSTTKRNDHDVLVWAFILVIKNTEVLTYRHGRYREDRDSFLKKRSLGFFSPVVQDDLTLFDQSDHGIVASGLRALNYDLDMAGDADLHPAANLDCFICADDESGKRNLLAVVSFVCPEWFEPLTRRLAINDLRWCDLRTPVNHIEDFDPWSQAVLGRVQQKDFLNDHNIEEAAR